MKKPTKKTGGKSNRKTAQKVKAAPKKIADGKTIKTLVKEHANKTGILPLGNRVLIKPYTKEELTEKNNFGIILPDSDKKAKSDQGIVVAVGPGEYHDGKLVNVKVKVGDRVAFSKYGYEDLSYKDEDFFLIKEENILAVLN